MIDIIRLKQKTIACLLILSLLTTFAGGCSLMRDKETSQGDDEKDPRHKNGFFSKGDDEEKKQRQQREGYVREETFDVAGSDYDLRVEYYLNKDFPVPEEAEYNTFDVIKVYEDREEKVYSFDKQESFDNGETIRGVKLMEGFKDRRGTLVFTLEDPIIGGQSILVLGDADGDYRELLYTGCYGDYQFRDIDADGTTEILTSASNGGGYVSWWVGFYIAHTLSGGVYEPSYALTRAYYESLINEREKAFNKKKTSENLKTYMEAMAFNGAVEDIELIIQTYPDLVAELDDTLSEDIPAETFAEYASNQALNYRSYWEEVFSSDPSYERQQKEKRGDSLEDPFHQAVRDLGDQEEILLDERQDIDLDGQEEAVLATGSEGEVFGLYCFRMDGNRVERLEPDGFEGYGIYKVRLIQMDNSPQTYIYCGLTNFANLYGFALYEAEGSMLKQVCYSASATGAGEDYLLDTNGDGRYDYMEQDRFSYDVLYFPLTREFAWNGKAFVSAMTRVSLPDYPTDVEEVVLQYLSLRLIDDGLCPDVTNRLKELCALKGSDIPLDPDIWFNGILYAHMGLDQTELSSEVKGSEATVTVTYKDDDGKTHSLTLLLAVKDDKWRIKKVS